MTVIQCSDELFPRGTPISLRPAAYGDVSAVAELLEHLGYILDFSQFSAIFAQALQDPGLEIILAEDHQKAQGLITLRSVLSLRLSGLLMSIKELVVRPESRGAGLGNRREIPEANLKEERIAP